MSTKAQMILQEIRELSPEDRREIAESLRAGAEAPPVKRGSVQSGRGMFAGGGLLEALLSDRANERARERARA